MASNDVNDENCKNEKVTDSDLDELLDDALGDFENISSQQKKKQPEKLCTDKPQKSTVDNTEFPLGDPLNDDMFNDLYENIFKMMSSELKEAGSSPNQTAGAQNNESFDDTNGDVSEIVQKALNSLNEDLDNIEGGDVSQAEMMDMFSKINMDGGDTSIMPLVHDMMSNLLSKDVLYPSLKEISRKYPQWLTENKDKLEAKELKRYKEQSRLMEEITSEYEAESSSDTDKSKKERFERILDRMQLMQQLGQPPKDIVGDMPNDLQFDEGKFPGMSESSLDPNQCSVS